ncbi:MFS transporter [Acetobacteraceae bacterium]|nr:MFS transporter [Acetobacteraceae bacterium]
MFPILLRSIRKYAWLRGLLCALICSSIGSGLTFIMVFGALAKLKASPSSFALAFILSILPGFFGSILGKSLLEKIEAKYCFILAEAIGALGLLIPYYGLHQESVFILQLTETASSLAAGILIPSLNHYSKTKLDPQDIASASIIDTLVFTCQVLFGIGLGAFLYGKIENSTYLLTDLFSYLIAIFFLFLLPKLGNLSKENPPVESLPNSLSSRQHASLYLLPALAATSAAAMSLLPTLIHASQKDLLLLLFSRSLGQLMGPFLIKEERYKNHSSFFIFICLLIFIGCYLCVPLTQSFLIALVLVFSAHIFSNIVYSLGWYSLLTNFNQQQIAAASANSYQKQIFVSAIVSLLAGILADKIGSSLSLFLCSFIGLSLSAIILFRTKNRT